MRHGTPKVWIPNCKPYIYFRYLIFASCKTITLHGTHIAVARVVKLSYCRGMFHMVQDRRKAATESCYHITCHVPPQTHGTHLSHSITKLP